MNDTAYTVLQVAKGSVVNECVRCGAVVFHRTIHDAWHVMIDARLGELDRLDQR